MTTIDPNIAFSSASTDRTLSTRAPAKRGWAIAGVLGGIARSPASSCP